MTEAESIPGMYCLGVNYRTSTVAVRERFAVTRARVPEAVKKLRQQPGIDECVLLSTCNRTEIYYWSTCPEVARASILSSFLGVGFSSRAESCFCFYEGEDALAHLACVAGGLDSMVVGETEIFGQLKEAYQVALQAGTTAACSNRVFQQVFTIGKKIRSTSRITSGPTSVGAAAVQLAQNCFGDLSGVSVLVVGAGEVARTTAQSLKSRGAESIFVANRSYDKAVELASVVGGRVVRFSEWLPYLEHIDIVIVSTAAPVYVVNPDVLRQVQQVRKRPLFLVDLSVPRNIDPGCAAVEEVHLYDMDAMEKLTAETRSLRQAEVVGCQSLVQAWVEENRSSLLENRRYYTGK